MRLTEEQVLTAMERPGRDLRYAAARYFAIAASPNAAVMPAVIAAIEQHGPSALLSNAPLADLAQTPETIAWSLAQLVDPQLDPDLREHLSRLVRSVDPRLLAPHAHTIRQSQTIWPELRRDCAERIRLLKLDASSLWKELEQLCHAGRHTLKSGEIDYRGGERIVDALACDAANAGAMLERLTDCACALPADDQPNHSAAWMECFLALLAGQMREEAATAALVDKLKRPGQILTEESLRALIRIGAVAGDRVVAVLKAAVAEDGGDKLRDDCSVIYGAVHCDAAVEAGLASLAAETDSARKGRVAEQLLWQFSTEVNEAVRQLTLEHPDLEEQLLEELVVAATIVGQEFPEMKAWRNQAAAIARDRESKILAFRQPANRKVDAPAPLRRPEAAVGRNDACPCGSGKKFKKCCLARAEMGG